MRQLRVFATSIVQIAKLLQILQQKMQHLRIFATSHEATGRPRAKQMLFISLQLEMRTEGSRQAAGKTQAVSAKNAVKKQEAAGRPQVNPVRPLGSQIDKFKT